MGKKRVPNRRVVSISFTTEQYKKLLTQLPEGATMSSWIKVQIFKIVYKASDSKKALS